MSSQRNQRAAASASHSAFGSVAALPSTSMSIDTSSSTLPPSSAPLHSPTSPRPSISRTQSLATSTSHAVPAPFYTPQTSSVNVPQLAFSRRLLMPTVRTSRSPSRRGSPAGPPMKYPSPHKLGLSRTGTPATGSELNYATSSCNVDWIGGRSRFEVVENHVELEGYQLYAVEKWVVERTRPVTVLTVFTGDPRHKITVTALSPRSSLPQAEALQAWDKAINLLRDRDGARPKETDKGVVMVTSLANFPSNFTIVHIPFGNFMEVREQLYTNINILRMGCTGRSALMLEEPSDTTKDRFLSMYHIPDKALARSFDLFNTTVLELVKLIQAALAIFGMFDMAPEERNGLMCDVTCKGIQQWVKEIGEPCMDIEPTERVADPTVVAALFSMILSVRNKLHALGHAVPKDPFIDPISFVRALASFQGTKPHGHAHTLSLTGHHSHSHSPSPSSSSITPVLNSSPAPTPAQPSPFIPPQSPPQTHPHPFLTRPLIDAIQAAYDKAKQSEPYKVHRVLISKLDDLATDLRTESALSGKGKGKKASAGDAGIPTTDLGTVVAGASAKEGAPSLRLLWGGRPGEVERRRREREAVLSEGEEREAEREREREERERDARSSEDEGEGANGKAWGGKVQRKFESWAALGRAKKLSVDFGNRGKGFMVSPESPTRGQSEQALAPSVVVTRYPEEEDVLSSGQVSPVSDSQAAHQLLTSLGALPKAQHSAGELSEYDRRITEFDRRRPQTKPPFSRIVSWSDPRTARHMLHEAGDDDTRHRRDSSALSASPSVRDDEGDDRTDADADDCDDDRRTVASQAENEVEAARLRTHGVRRRRSFDDAQRLRARGRRVLPVEYQRIDVQLAGELLAVRRREAHLSNVLACLRALTHTLSASNAALRSDYTAHQPALAALEARTAVLQSVVGDRARVDAMTQETQALAYESAQFRVEEVWSGVAQSRARVLEVREKVFGTGRRVGGGGRFRRVQWRVDGGRRLVDALGRTESEAEEEEGLPGGLAVREEEEEEEEGEVVEHPSLRPTWLLQLFNYWGSRWGSGGGEDKKEREDVKEDERDRAKATTSSVESSTAADESSLSMRRNHTA